MFKASRSIVVIICALALNACQTTDSSMREAGHSEAYVAGFHDGRHTGMEEAGNTWEHYTRDHERYDNDEQYQAGCLSMVASSLISAVLASVADREMVKR